MSTPISKAKIVPMAPIKDCEFPKEYINITPKRLNFSEVSEIMTPISENKIIVSNAPIKDKSNKMNFVPITPRKLF